MEGFAARILRFVKQIFLLLVRGFQKLICIRRKKKLLKEDDPLAEVVITPTVVPSAGPQDLLLPNQIQYNHYYSSKTNNVNDRPNVNMEEWNNWENTEYNSAPAEVSATVYSSNSMDKNEAPEPEIDFFKDMEPTVKVKKVLVKKKTSNVVSNRLAMDQDLDFKVSGDLEDWDEDEDDAGWVEEDVEGLEIDEAKIAREAQEQRKLERQMRAKQQRLQKSIKPHDKLGLKVS